MSELSVFELSEKPYVILRFFCLASMELFEKHINTCENAPGPPRGPTSGCSGCSDVASMWPLQAALSKAVPPSGRTTGGRIVRRAARAARAASYRSYRGYKEICYKNQ